MSNRERFAGISPGLMLVLGADISAENFRKQLQKGKAKKKPFWREFSVYLVGNTEEALDWLEEHKITPKGFLGGGAYGKAFIVDHPDFGNDIVLKLTQSDNEIECIEEIFQLHNHKKYDSYTSSLPEIYSWGEFTPDPGTFFYLRPMYKMWTGGDDPFKAFYNIFKETKGEYFPFDLHKGNLGRGEGGQPVHFDPHCRIRSQESWGESESAREKWEEYFDDKISKKGIQQLAAKAGVSTGQFRAEMRNLLGKDRYEDAVEHFKSFYSRLQRTR